MNYKEEAIKVLAEMDKCFVDRKGNPLDDDEKVYFKMKRTIENFETLIDFQEGTDTYSFAVSQIVAVMNFIKIFFKLGDKK